MESCTGFSYGIKNIELIIQIHWQIYRHMANIRSNNSNSDVILFARDMVEDIAMCAHLDRCIRSNLRFYEIAGFISFLCNGEGR